MVDVMHGIETDVPFDHATCDDLIAFCTTTASAVDDQAGSRAHAVSTGAADFRGLFSELFASNAMTARVDAGEVAMRLREIAALARDLQAHALAEQQRRETARNWAHERENRNLLEQGYDEIRSWFDSEAEARPPVGPSDPPPHAVIHTSATGVRHTPQPGSGGRGAGTSSARPGNLRSFASVNRDLNYALVGKPDLLSSKLTDFAARCRWGSLDGSSVVMGFRQWNQANDEDVRWADTVAQAFEMAGGAGDVAFLSDSALASALIAADVDITRDDIAIDPAIAIGAPPTTGYAVDPVNTATGNFLETEVDLGFAGAAQPLTWARTYNSFDDPGGDAAGAFGPGWSSWAEAGVTFTDEGARLRRDDGRVSVFPRLDQGWDRAVGEKLWLARTDDGGYRVSDNSGGTWDYLGDGRPHRVATGPGTEVTFHHDDEGRLSRLQHVRGRSLDVTWDGDRIVSLTASDGRTATFGYDQQGLLVTATGDRGVRSYDWNEQGLIGRVTDADGVVEVDNTYDADRRVTRQRTPHGRTVRFAYLAGRITVVSDENGARSNTWVHDPRGRLLGVVDAHDRRQSMSYDRFGNLVLVTERDGGSTVHEYDDRGRRVRTVTPGGADLSFGYDDLDRVTTVVTESGAISEYTYEGTHRNPSQLRDPEGGLTRFVWDDGLLTEVVDPTDVRVRLSYDDFGDLVGTTDAEGNTARLERDAVGRVTAAVTPSGNRTDFTYDERGRLVSRRDPDGAHWRFEHTQGGRLAAVIDPLGARTEMEYGAHGETERTVDPLGRSVVRTLDDLGNLASVRLPDGATWSFTHDALSRLVETVDPTGGRWRHEYDENGRPTATIDPTEVRQTVATNVAAGTVRVGDGSVDISTRFDPLGRLLSVDQPDGSTALATYDRCGRAVELLDPEGGLTRLVRDAAGRVVQVTTPAGSVSRFDYDRCGRLVGIVDALGARTTREYDADGRVVRVILPTGEVSSVTYDAVGRVVTVREVGRGTARYVYDAAGRVSQSSDSWFGRRIFRYDAAGQLAEVVNGVGGVTRFSYDPNGRAVEITDALGHTTRREFDAMNRCVAETDPLGRTTRALYDGGGRQVSQTDPEGRVLGWTFDAAGRPETTSVDGRVVSSIERDIRGRRVVLTDHTADGGPTTHELEWNRLGRLVRRARGDRAVSWTYDADGRRVGMTTPDGGTTSYTWDAAGALTAIEHSRLGRATFVRDAFGRLVEANTGGVLQTWEHHDGFVVGHTVTDADESTRTVIERDDDGRVVAVSRDGETTRYDYDDARQLVAAHLGDAVRRWTYDVAGRLVAESVEGGGAEQLGVDHAYDAAGQLLTSRTSTGAVTEHAYDARGQRTRTAYADGRLREFTWSDTGWLSAVTDHAGDQVRRTATHVDALGELASVDGTDLWWDTASFAPNLLLAGDRSVLSTGAATAVAGPLEDPAGGAGGGAWSVPGWRNARSGSLDLDPWGSAVAADLPGGLAIGPAGELTLGGEQPLEWMGARVYDPASRGFLSVDPLDAVPGAGWAGNPYAYAGNDPLHALDPLGLRPATDTDLAAYAQAHTGPLAGAKEWVKDNWEYLAGGAMVIAGGVLIATGVGGPLGMMLVSAGADTIIQKATTGSVDWGQVAISGAAGGFTGVGVAARLGATGPVANAVVSGAVSGGVEGGASGAYGYLSGQGPHTAGGLIESVGSGASRGAVMGGASSAARQGLKTLGGVQLHSVDPVPDAPAARCTSVEAARDIPGPTAGQKLFRVYGGDSKAGGASWSPVDPSTTPNYRDIAGLPSGGASNATNTGQFVLEGTLIDPGAVVLKRNALPLDGAKGGLPEYIVPNWMDNGAITIDRVSGVNPAF